jgi:hypothetical protein
MPINFQVVLNELGGSRLQFVKRSPRRAGHVMANGPRVIKRVLLDTSEASATFRRHIYGTQGLLRRCTPCTGYSFILRA